jgi:hypothetical protein
MNENQLAEAGWFLNYRNPQYANKIYQFVFV